MNLNELKKMNGGYFLGAGAINQKDLDIVNNLISKIENTRTKNVQDFDNVEYTNKYGEYYPNALAKFNYYYDDKFCIVQSASCHLSIYDNKLCASISGGSFDSDKKADKFIYKGRTRKTFWTWCSHGAGASHGLYFTANVSNFIYNERPEELKHLTTQKLTKYYLCDSGEDTEDQYRYTAYSSGKAWRSKTELDAFITKYHAVWENDSILWAFNDIKKYCFDRKEFDAIDAVEFIARWNGSDVAQKEVIKDNNLITYIDRSKEPRYISK